MVRYAAAAVLAVLASVPLAFAADKPEKAEKPHGEWTHTVNECIVTFKFEKHEMTVDYTKGDGESIHTVSDYGATADGLVFGVVTKVEKKGTDAGPQKGDLFSFAAKFDKGMLTISDLNSGTSVSDEAKQLIGGEYKAVKKDK